MEQLKHDLKVLAGEALREPKRLREILENTTAIDTETIGYTDADVQLAAVVARVRGQLDHAGDAPDEPHPGEDWTP